MQEKVVMEGESLGYVLGAVALTFSPWCWGSFELHQRRELRVTAGHAPRIPISEMKTLSFSEIEGFIPSHTVSKTIQRWSKVSLCLVLVLPLWELDITPLFGESQALCSSCPTCSMCSGDHHTKSLGPLGFCPTDAWLWESHSICRLGIASL